MHSCPCCGRVDVRIAGIGLSGMRGETRRRRAISRPCPGAPVRGRGLPPPCRRCCVRPTELRRRNERFRRQVAARAAPAPSAGCCARHGPAGRASCEPPRRDAGERVGP